MFLSLHTAVHIHNKICVFSSGKTMLNESKIGEVNYTLWEIVRDDEELCEIKMQQKRINHKEML